MSDNDGKLSMEELLTQAAGGTVIPKPAVETATATTTATTANTPGTAVVEPVATNTVVEEPKVEPPKVEAPKVEEPKKPDANPIKEVRDRLAAEKAEKDKINGAIKKYSAGNYAFKLSDYLSEDGSVDYDGMIAAMAEVDLKAKAELKGISPEVQAELDRIEKEKIEIQKERLQLSMDKALTNLQIDMGLKSADVNNFFKDSMQSGKNPYQWLAQGGSLGDLYNIVYADKVSQTKIDAAVSAARATWEAERTARGNPPAVNPAAPKTSTIVGQKTGLSLDELLTAAATRKK